MNDKLINECYRKSIDLLLHNSNKYGVLASASSKRAQERNYLSIFARDASICALGMVASGNKKLIEAAKRSLLTLGKNQAKNGQIPNFVKPEKNYSDFWYVGCIDATLWWLVAIKYFDRYSSARPLLEKKLSDEVSRALNWLRSQEHQNFYLLFQNEASDWADIMPRSGYVLYTNALWFWIKRLYDREKICETETSFQYFFGRQIEQPKAYLEKNPRAAKMLSVKKNSKSDTLFSFVNQSSVGDEKDVFGNILACISGAIDNKEATKIIDEIYRKKASAPYPVKAVLVPIKKNSQQWRDYMSTHKQNIPYQYHNGGIWPFIGGFWAVILAQHGKKRLAASELENLASVNAQNNWQFNEWFHGQTGKPMGMPGQSWNAGTFLLAHHYLKGDFKF